VIVLNVGGGTSRDLPKQFKGWDQHILDIDPAVNPEVLCDAKEMRKLKSGKYDAIFCSHNLEHFYKHEVPIVLDGFTHVLKPAGYAQIIVPDLMHMFECIVKGNQDIDDVWYTASAPVRFHDVLYGWDAMMKQGNQYYAHKCGFSEKSLTKALNKHFKHVYTATDGIGNIFAYAFKATPTKEQRKCL
jgi:predicted SAM-dependent methyltransferase